MTAAAKHGYGHLPTHHNVQLYVRLTLKGAPHFACHFAACILPLQADSLSI